MLIKKMYFGHPINTYGTELEKFLLEKINDFLVTISFKNEISWLIENPGQKYHQEKCMEEKKRTGNAMNYFFNQVLPHCSAGIFLPFQDGKWGAGVAGEANYLMNRNCEVWKIVSTGDIFKLEKVLNTDVLSIEETRNRILDSQRNLKKY